MGFNLTPVVRNLLLINVLIFVLQYFMRLDLVNWLGMRYFLAATFAPYQLITHMFVHANFSHLLSNMLGLFVFGPMLEHFWGSKRFFIFYMICGVGAGLLYSGVNFYEIYTLGQAADTYISSPSPEALDAFFRDHARIYEGEYLSFINEFHNQPDNGSLIKDSKLLVRSIYDIQSNIPMVGASGAIFGILMAFGLLFPNTVLMLLFPPIPIKAKFMVAFYGIYAFFGAIQNQPGDNVAHYAHLGGMLIAFILIKFIWQNDRNRFY
jgi:membrane associated rhomboid family serine protease